MRAFENIPSLSFCHTHTHTREERNEFIGMFSATGRNATAARALLFFAGGRGVLFGGTMRGERISFQLQRYIVHCVRMHAIVIVGDG